MPKSKHHYSYHHKTDLLHYLYVVIIVSTLPLMGCTDNNGDYSFFATISGNVVDVSLGLPLDNAHITLSPTMLTATTDATGSFSFDNVDAGEYTITVQKTGYYPNRQIITATSGEVSHISIPLTSIEP